MNDLLSFGEFLLDDDDLLATMRVPVIEAEPGTEYGLGCFVAGDLVLHPGGWAGFGSLLLLAPERRLALTIVLNHASDHHHAVIGPVIGGVLRDAGITSPWPPWG